MSNIIDLPQERTAAGNDLSDHRNNPEVLAREKQRILDAHAQAMKPDEVFDLSKFSLNGCAREMESKMLDDKFILGRMAILGQSTVIYEMAI